MKRNMKQLSNQFFDDQLKEYVYSAKDFNVGDSIFFSDVIKDIVYDPKSNATNIKFAKYFKNKILISEHIKLQEIKSC